MKIYRSILMALLVAGLIGFYFYKLLPSPSQSSQSLIKWQKIEASRHREAKKIYKKATLIMSKLKVKTYSYHGLRIEKWEELSGDSGITIHYNSICVFSATDGIFKGRMEKVKAFHSGKWVAILQSIDIDKELTKKIIKELKGKYRPL